MHHNLGIAYRELGFFAEAERHFEQACRYVRPDWMRAITDLDRAILRLVVGDPAAAWELARHALAITERIRSSAVVAEARSVLGRIAATEGHHAKAQEELETALSLVPPGHVLLLAQIYEEFAALAVLRGDSDARSEAEMAAEQYYRKSEAIPRLERMTLRLEVLSTGASPKAG